MKIALALCLLAPAAAFVPRTAQLVRASARDVATEPESGDAPEAAAAAPEAAAAAAPVGNSIAMPFLPRPALLDGTLAGDVGFDPLGFADNYENLQFYADAEVKHARLAMLCAAGWPAAELLHPRLAALAGQEPLLAAGGRAPSVLNGGIFSTPGGLLGLAALVGGAAVVELASNANGRGWGKTDGALVTPGEIGFDPFGLYGKTDAARKTMRTKEIKNGRAAMIGVLAYVGAEAITGKPVVDLTPVFFKPIWAVVVGMLAGGATADADASLAAAYAAADAAAAAAAPAVVAAAPAAIAAAAPAVAGPVVEAAPAAVEAAAAVAEAPAAAVAEYVGAVYESMQATAPATISGEYAAAVYDDVKSIVPAVAEASADAVKEVAAGPAAAPAAPVVAVDDDEFDFSSLPSLKK